MNSTVRGIVYVSVCVVVWGTVASLMDWMLLVEEVYSEEPQANCLHSSPMALPRLFWQLAFRAGSLET